MNTDDERKSAFEQVWATVFNSEKSYWCQSKYSARFWFMAALEYMSSRQWQPIETAPKEEDSISYKKKYFQKDN